MIQRFIQLGEGYSDLYEWRDLATSRPDRVQHILSLHSIKSEKSGTSALLVLSPSQPGNFQPLYLCLEGIANPSSHPSKRFKIIEETAKQLNKEVIHLEVKPSTEFAEKELYYQYLTAILRLNHLIPPMS
jgi:hypothetical protein